jgi:hypothetical protein
MRHLPHAALLLLALSLPSAAAADGMVVYHSEVGDADAVQVEATTQRAALWYRNGAWELTIQPLFPRGEGGAAWIVPLPVAPVVTEASPDVLDGLELLTAPVFIPYCLETSGKDGGGLFGCAGTATDAKGGGGARTGVGESGVVVWAAGETGALEWVALEAPGAAAVIDWLEQEGYRVPAFIEEAPEVLDGQVVFAATLKADLDPGLPLPPMTFRLPGVAYDAVTYPLRLTAAVAPADGMELLLWVITPPAAKKPGALVPATIDWLPHHGWDVTRAEWEADGATLRTAFPPRGGLVLEYYRVLGDQPLFKGWPLVPPGGWAEVMPHEVGLQLPGVWPDEIAELGAAGARVARFRGRLTAAAMVEDLAFEDVPENQVPAVGNVIWREVPCAQIGVATAAAQSPLRPWLGAAVLALVALLSVGLLRRIHA